MKVIHCSDLALDAKMDIKLSAAESEQRNREIYMTFTKMIRFAIINEVSIILISGNLFDARCVSPRTIHLVFDAIHRAEQIEFLYLCDPIERKSIEESGEEIPANLKLMGEELSCRSYEHLDIWSARINAENRELVYQELKPDRARGNIVMLYGEAVIPCSTGEIDLQKLRNKNIHYLALGGRNNFKLGQLDEGGIYAYSGCLEGRAFDACGEKGFILLDIQKQCIKPLFIPFAERMCHIVEIDITGQFSADGLQQCIFSSIDGIPSKDIVRCRLTGIYTVTVQKELQKLQTALSKRFYYAEIVDDSILKLEKEDYEFDISLKGELLRLVMASEENDKDREQIIAIGMQVLNGGEIVI